MSKKTTKKEAVGTVTCYRCVQEIQGQPKVPTRLTKDFHVNGTLVLDPESRDPAIFLHSASATAAIVRTFNFKREVERSHIREWNKFDPVRAIEHLSVEPIALTQDEADRVGIGSLKDERG
jgi:hypothetical protein